MLVLNTHLDTLVSLDRFPHQSGQNEHVELIRSAVGAARGILAQRPAEALFKLVSKVLYLTFLPQAQAERLPVYLRAFKRFGWKWLAPRLHLIKTAFPRLVMPGGYVDRALSIKGVSDAYQSINLMDLLRFVRRFPMPEVDTIIHEALAFTAIQACWVFGRKPQEVLCPGLLGRVPMARLHALSQPGISHLAGRGHADAGSQQYGPAAILIRG